jgi:exonuclease V
VLYVSDSKTRAAGTMPKEENSNNGKMQLMLYKEMLDSMVVEGLRQYARDERSPLSAQNASADEVEVVGERLEDEVVCIDEDEDEVAAIKPKEASPLLEGKLSGKVSTSTDSAIDPFTWQDLFDHLALDASQPFTETFLAQSRPLIEGNSLSATVAGARNLQQMTRCWAEYTSRLGLGTIDPNLDDAGIEEALDKETGGRKIGRSEKLLSLVYRRVGKSTKMKARRTQSATDNGRVKERSNGKKRRKRGKGALDDVEAVPSLSIEESSRGEGVATTDSPPIQSLNAMEVEEERTLQLAIAESLSIPLEFSEFISRGSKIEGPCPDTSAGDEEQLPESLLPRRSSTEDVKQYPSQPGPLQSESSDTVEPALFINSEQSSPSPAEAEAPGTDGSIIGSHRFAYSSTLLADHIERILQFWTGAREPVGVTIENTSRCGWCEFEDGCEWR